MKFKFYAIFFIFIIVLSLHIYFLNVLFFSDFQKMKHEKENKQNQYGELLKINLEARVKKIKKHEPRKIIKPKIKKNNIKIKKEKVLIRKKKINRAMEKIVNKNKMQKKEESIKSTNENFKTIQAIYLKKYLDYAYEILAKNKFYPKFGRYLKLQGKCLLSFKINKNGEILGLRLKEKTKFDILNKAALKVFTKIKRFKHFPLALKKENISFLVPFIYKIKG